MVSKCQIATQNMFKFKKKNSVCFNFVLIDACIDDVKGFKDLRKRNPPCSSQLSEPITMMYLKLIA